MTKNDVITKSMVIDKILKQAPKEPMQNEAMGYAPTNIALCKYWGKRDNELNLPMTSSLSVALPEKGAMTTFKVNDLPYDEVMLNGELVPSDSEFFTRLENYLSLFRKPDSWHLSIDIKMTIPVAAGLASSACGFASLAYALNDLFQWKLTLTELSILARLGSGSAARSLYPGFVEWHMGNRADGMDSYAEPLGDVQWPDLTIGILPLSDAKKPISSREAMRRTVNSSVLYNEWPKKVSQDMVLLKQAIKVRNFSLLGGTAESNALSMHATMLGAWPPVCYYLPETIKAMHDVWALRETGVEVFFTQDAGPNLKLLFLRRDEKVIRDAFPDVDVVPLFE